MTVINKFSVLRDRAGIPVAQLADMLGYSERTIMRWEKGEAVPRKSALATLEHMVQQRFDYGKTQKASGAFRFIDLFAGIGGLRRGFDAIGGRCVFTSEWNQYARQTYAANYHDGDDHMLAGDITQILASDIPAHDVLLAGFPCQPFSIAGVSKKNALGRAHGFACAAQGTLFFDVARIIQHHQPKAFLLENVKNLLSHDKGNTFRVIRQTLTEELGYHISWRVIDARSFVPQHRERIFIVGFRDHADFTLDNLVLPAPANGPRIGTILHGHEGTFDRHYTDAKGKVSDKYTLTDKLWQYLQDYTEKHRQKGNGFGFGLVGPDDVARTLSARYYKDGSEILVWQPGRNPRRLTPRECARLMGFDRPGESLFRIPVSDTQAYKQFGNAVVVPVVHAVAAHMAPLLVSEGVKSVPSLEMAGQ